MIRVMPLPHGWELYATEAALEVGGWVPVFRRRDGTEKTPFEVARVFGARAIFHELKRRLDVMDLTWRNPALDPRWKVANMAKMAMQDELERCGLWSWDLLETGIGVEV